MKTIITTAAILLVTVFGLSNSTYATAAKDSQAYTILTNVSNINKIEVHGNVELYLSAGPTDEVKVYNQYYKETALVQNQNGALCISSYKTEKLVVWITASDLRNLEVYDNASVKSFGKLSAIDIDVKLYDNATAKLNMDAFRADITLNDNARANIEGSVTYAALKYNKVSMLTTTNLVADNIIKTDVDGIKDSAADFVSL